VPSNKSKGFRPVRFDSAFGSWVGAQSGEIAFSTPRHYPSSGHLAWSKLSLTVFLLLRYYPEFRNAGVAVAPNTEQSQSSGGIPVPVARSTGISGIRNIGVPVRQPAALRKTKPTGWPDSLTHSPRYSRKRKEESF